MGVLGTRTGLGFREIKFTTFVLINFEFLDPQPGKGTNGKVLCAFMYIVVLTISMHTEKNNLVQYNHIDAYSEQCQI